MAETDSGMIEAQVFVASLRGDSKVRSTGKIQGLAVCEENLPCGNVCPQAEKQLRGEGVCE